MKKTTLAITVALALSGCASQKPADTVVIDNLGKIALEVHAELKRLNDIEQRPVAEPISDVQGCSAKAVSLDFDGDIMLFVEDLRKSNICSVRVIGKKPQQDLILSLHHKSVPLWQILEDASVQLGKMATVTVGAESVVIQLNGGVQQ